MDDYSSYLSALQASDLLQQQADQRQEDKVIPIEEKASIPGLATGSVLGMGPIIKNVGVNVAKGVLKSKLKEAGVSDDQIENILKGDLTDVSSKAKDILAAAKETLQGKADALKKVATDAVDSVKQTIQDTVDTARQTATGVADGVQEAVSGAADAAQEAASGAVDAAQSIATGAQEAVSGATGTASEATTTGESMFSTLRSIFGGDVPDSFSGGLDSVRSLLQRKLESGIDLVTPIDSEFGGGTLQAPRMLEQFGSLRPLVARGDMGLAETEQSSDGIFSRLAALTKQAVSEQMTATDPISETLGNTLSQVQTGVSEAMTQAASTASEAATSLAGTATDAATSLAGTASQAVGAATEAAGAAAETTGAAVTETAGAVGEGVGAAAAEVAGDVIAGIGSVASEALGPLGLLAGLFGSIFGALDSEKAIAPPQMLLNPSSQFI